MHQVVSSPDDGPVARPLELSSPVLDDLSLLLSRLLVCVVYESVDRLWW